MRVHFLFYFFLFLGITSCKNNSQESHGAIVLGDSTTILTESSPEYLADYVADIKKQENTPVAPTPLPDTTVGTAEVKKDTLKPTEPAKNTSLPQKGKGLTIDFNEVTVSIPDIDTRSFKNQNLKTLNGVSYQLTSGTLQGNKLTVKAAAIEKVSQRYITTLVVSNSGKTLELDNMNQAGAWKVLKGTKGTYPITGLEPSQLEYKKTNAGAIRTAVSRTVRASRMNRSEINEWENSVKNLKSPAEAPVSVILQSIMWRIEGKDAKGNAFNKEVRIDMPI